MKFKGLEESKIESDNLLFEMSSIRKRTHTKLPCNVFFGTKYGDQMHSPRIKFQNSYSDRIIPEDLVPMLILTQEIPINFNQVLKPKDLDYLIRFVKANKQVFLDVWFDKIDENEIYNKLLFEV